MKSCMLAGAAALAIIAMSASAQGTQPFPVGEGAFDWESYEAFAEKYDLSGQTVTVTGPWTGLDNDNVTVVLSYFESATGATVNYSGSDSFEQDIVISARAGSAPNVAVFPQPGPGVGHGVARVSDSAARRHGRLDPRQLRRRQVLGRSGDLRERERRGGALRLLLQGRCEIAGLVQPRLLLRDGLRDPRDDGGAEGAHRPDRRGWRHALVHRPRLRRGDGLARHRLGRGHDAAHPSRRRSTTNGWRTRSRSTIPGWSRRSRNTAISRATRTT